MAQPGTTPKNTVTLENLSRAKPITFELSHETACTEKDCRCHRQVVGVRDHDPKTGERALRAMKRRLPGAVTLLARGTRGGGDVAKGLPMGIRRLPAVIAAVARGDVKLTVVGDDGKPIEKKPAPAAAAPAAAPAPAAPPKASKPGKGAAEAAETKPAEAPGDPAPTPAPKGRHGKDKE